METPAVTEIQKHLGDLDQLLARLAQQQTRPRADFDRDPRLRQEVESSLESAAKTCAAICRRIIAAKGAPPPLDDYQAVIGLGELGVLTPQFAKKFAPVANLHNVVAQANLGMNWDAVYHQLQNMEGIERFCDTVRNWIKGELMI